MDPFLVATLAVLQIFPQTLLEHFLESAIHFLEVNQCTLFIPNLFSFNNFINQEQLDLLYQQSLGLLPTIT